MCDSYRVPLNIYFLINYLTYYKTYINNTDGMVLRKHLTQINSVPINNVYQN